MARVPKICLGVSVFLILIGIVILTLALTIFKTHDPVVSIELVGLKQFSPAVFVSTTTINVSIPTMITMGNPNRGSFKYIDSKGYVHFHDDIVGDLPIGAALVPSRGSINVSTNTAFMVQKLTHEKNFWADLLGGPLNFISTSELRGKAIVLKFIKVKATSYTTCNISVNVTSMSSHSKCASKIKLF